MKKILLAVGIIASVFAASSCSGDEGQKSESRVRPDSAVVCNFRYARFDTVLYAYTLSQELNGQLNKEQSIYRNAYAQKEAALNRLSADMQGKYNRGEYMTQTSLQTDQANLESQARVFAQWDEAQQQRLVALNITISQRLNDSLMNFLKDYNAEHKYDAIFNSASGYFDPSLDITQELIDGLNARYTPSTTTTDTK